MIKKLRLTLLFLFVWMPFSFAETLTTTAEIRSLTLAEAELQLPVKIRGIILYADPIDGHSFIHDDTGSIFFRPGRANEPGAVRPAVGELVELAGVSVGGMFSPSIAGIGSPSRTQINDQAVRPVILKVLGKEPLPDPAPIPIQRAMTGEFHDQYIELQGTIRTVRPSDSEFGHRILFEFSSPFVKKPLPLFLPSSDTVPVGWENTPATIQCIASGGSSSRDSIDLIRFLLPTLAQIQPHFDQLEAAFESPIRPFHQLFSYSPGEKGNASPRRIHIEGTVTHSIPGEGFYLAENDPASLAGIYVQTPQLIALRPGDQVGVVGFPMRNENASFLGDGIVRKRGRKSAPTALDITPAEASSGDHHSALISLEGSFVESSTEEDHLLITLRTDGPFVLVRFPLTETADLPEISPDAWVKITGILDPENSRTALPSTPIQLIGRSFRDVKVLREPPWLSPHHLRWIAIGLTTLVILTIVWIAILRWQVSRQSRSLASQAAQQSIAEERQRIARELHDTLEQQLTGIQLHLDALDDWMEESPAHMREAVTSARAMLEHSRTESRQSVLQLRSPALEKLGLLGAIQHNAQIIAPTGIPNIDVSTTGYIGHWPRIIEFHILRIAQEAIANAVKHADCNKVSVKLDYLHEGLEILIQDDGSGFDHALISQSGSGFGLLGIRERILKIRASLEIDSAPGKGTKIQICVPRTGTNAD